jgi:hypothetical protein
LRGKDGQVSVLIAAFMALAMVMLAFGIDVAHALVQKRHVQNVADAAALAAGRWLPLDRSGCDASQWDIPGTCAYNISQTAQEYSNYNHGPNIPFPECTRIITFNCFVTPYGTGPNRKLQVQIIVHEDVHLWFAGVVPGLAGAIKGVSAKAVGMPGPVAGPVTTAGTTVDGTTIDGTTIDGTTIDGTTNAGTTDPGTTIYGTTDPGTTIVGTTNPGTVSTTYTPTTSTTLINNPGGTGGAMFAMSADCNAFTYGGTAGGPGKTFGTVGSVISNGGAQITGDNGKTIYALAVGKKDTCYTNTAATILNLPVVGPFSPQAWPVPIPTVPTPGSGCTQVAAGPFLAAGHPAGVYCVISSNPADILRLSTKNADWTGYTFYAPSINISAGGQTFATAPKTTVLDAYLGDLTINGGGGGGNSVTGYMFAPNGQVALSGGGVSSGSGYIEAQTISVTGNSASYTGTGPGGSFSTTTTTDTVTTVTTYPGTTDAGSTVAGTTNSGSTVAASTSSGTTSPGTTTNGYTQPSTTLSGTTSPGSTQMVTTGTTVALNE